MFFERFHFFDPGPLVDGDIELLAPHTGLVDDVLISCSHPLTQLYAPGDSQITRDQLLQFLANCPMGRELGNAADGRVPQYHFWMRLREGWWGHPQSPPIRVVGGISLRIGSTPTVEMYYGHLGYHIYPAARGHHYASRACRLLFPLARHHGFKSLWITCNPENVASRRTCEKIGAKLIETVSVPPELPLFARGEKQKCRYRLELPDD